MKYQLDRRDFLKKSTKAGLGMAFGSIAISSYANEVLPALSSYPFKLIPKESIRIGMVGVGGMGTNHYNNFLKIKGCEIVAVSDIVESKVKRVQALSEKAGQKKTRWLLRK